MRTLIISDTHIGDIRFHNEFLAEVLKKKKFDRLVLNGDFVDLWLSSLEQIKNDPLFKLVQEVAKKKEVIWILGNHDNDIIKSKDEMPNIKFVEQLEFIDNNKHILIIHGHQLYEHKNMSWNSIWATKINNFIYRHFGIDLQTFFNTSKIYMWTIRRRRNSILNAYGKNVDIIIIGHTHTIGYTSDGKTELFDIGSAIITKSWASINDGSVWVEVNWGENQ
jgi:predicted phosphodiesterase